MKSTPRLIIDLGKIVANYLRLKKRADRAGVAITVVLKGIAGDLRIVRSLVEAGAQEIGDSRLENLRSFQRAFPNIRRMMLRLPQLSRIEETVASAQISLNAEISTLEGLHRLGIPHEVMLMVDLGDLREGVDETGLISLAKACRRFSTLKVTALGANFSCFAGAAPTAAKLERLVTQAQFLRSEFQFPVEMVSGGNSSSLPLLYQNRLPAGINQLRIGEAILLGRETMHGQYLADLCRDAFIVEAEVLQVQRKPACPKTGLGLDAFGRLPNFPADVPGIKALLNIGHQDTSMVGLIPLDSQLTILGGSSDYLVVTGEEAALKVGRVLRFIPNYWGLLSLMTSTYVAKTYLQ